LTCFVKTKPATPARERCHTPQRGTRAGVNPSPAETRWKRSKRRSIRRVPGSAGMLAVNDAERCAASGDRTHEASVAPSEGGAGAAGTGGVCAGAAWAGATAPARQGGEADGGGDRAAHGLPSTARGGHCCAARRLLDV
jgi:hypothetical protein